MSRGRQSLQLPADVLKCRKAEQIVRANRAQERALKALRELFPEEYEELRVAYRAEVDQERGPLPGD